MKLVSITQMQQKMMEVVHTVMIMPAAQTVMAHLAAPVIVAIVEVGLAVVT